MGRMTMRCTQNLLPCVSPRSNASWRSFSLRLLGLETIGDARPRDAPPAEAAALWGVLPVVNKLLLRIEILERAVDAMWEILLVHKLERARPVGGGGWAEAVGGGAEAVGGEAEGEGREARGENADASYPNCDV